MKSEVKVTIKVQGSEEKQKVLQAITSHLGIDYISTATDSKGWTVKVVGSMDSIDLTNKLRKRWRLDEINIRQNEEPKFVPSLRKLLNKQNLPKKEQEIKK